MVKIKLGDKVVPAHLLGTVISIKDEEVVIEWFKDGKSRKSFLTQAQAKLRSITLEEHVDQSLMIVYLIENSLQAAIKDMTNE